MGLFKQRAKNSAEIERLKGEITAMADRLEANEAAKERLGTQVHTIVARLDTPPPAPPEPPPSVHPDEFAALFGRVQELSQRIEQADARITSIATELANQISELGGELEGLQGAGDVAQIADQLHDAQVKLANEQARYQIAFRHDLAELADFLKRS